jgi:hypothetical protein
MKLKHTSNFDFVLNVREYEKNNGKFHLTVKLADKDHVSQVFTNIMYVNKSLNTICCLASTPYSSPKSTKLVIIDGLAVEIMDVHRHYICATLIVTETVFEAQQVSHFLGGKTHTLVGESKAIDFSKNIIIIPYAYCDLDVLRSKTFERTVYSAHMPNVSHFKSRFVYRFLQQPLDYWRATFQMMKLDVKYQPIVYFHKMVKCPLCREHRSRIYLYNCHHYCCHICQGVRTACPTCHVSITSVDIVADELAPYYGEDTVIFRQMTRAGDFQEEWQRYQKGETRSLVVDLKPVPLLCDTATIRQVIVYCHDTLSKTTVDSIIHVFCSLREITIHVGYHAASFVKLWEQCLQQ